MKKKYIFLIFTIMIHQAIAGSKESQPLAQSDEGKRIFDVVTEMSSANNIRGLMETLPEIDKLWNSDPSGYLQAMDISIHALAASPDPQASNAADAAASKVFEKKRPANNETAANYFVIKKNIIKQIERRAKPSDNKRVMILMADLLSEVRLQRIPNFQSEVIQHPGRKILEDAGVRRPEDLPTAIQKKAVADAVKRNEDNQKLQSLQQVLSSMDTALTHALIEKAHRLPMQGIQEQKFVRELAERAKLTAKERDKLESPE